MSHAEVQAFFEAYRDAFNRLDGDAVADLWHTPSTITSTEAEAASAKLTLWSDEEPMRFLLQDFRTGYSGRTQGATGDGVRGRTRENEDACC